MARTHTGNWIVLLDDKADAATTAAFADKVNALGAERGFAVKDHFPGTLLLRCDEAFARDLQQRFPDEVAQVAAETVLRLPENPRTRLKPPRPR